MKQFHVLAPFAAFSSFPSSSTDFPAAARRYAAAAARLLRPARLRWQHGTQYAMISLRHADTSPARPSAAATQQHSDGARVRQA